MNSGGTKLKNQEIRNGAYQSKFYDMLHEINDVNTKWRTIFGDKHKHSKDVELLLRFSAIQKYFKLKDDGEVIINKYNGSYTKMLNDFSDEAVNFDDYEVDRYKIDLTSFIDRFEINTKVPPLLLESLYFVSLYIDNNKYKITKELCENIINDSTYQSYVKSPNSAKIKVKERLEYVYRKVQEYIKSSYK